MPILASKGLASASSYGFCGNSGPPAPPPPPPGPGTFNGSSIMDGPASIAGSYSFTLTYQNGSTLRDQVYANLSTNSYGWQANYCYYVNAGHAVDVQMFPTGATWYTSDSPPYYYINAVAGGVYGGSWTINMTNPTTHSPPPTFSYPWTPYTGVTLHDISYGGTGTFYIMFNTINDRTNANAYIGSTVTFYIKSTGIEYIINPNGYAGVETYYSGYPTLVWNSSQAIITTTGAGYTYPPQLSTTY